MPTLLYIEDFKTVPDLVKALKASWGEIVVLTSKTVIQDKVKAESFIKNYNSGGDPDIWLDIVTTPNHYFISALKESAHE
jgi:hypothetical protein